MKKLASAIALAVIFAFGSANTASAAVVPLDRKAVVKFEKERSISLEKERNITFEKER